MKRPETIKLGKAAEYSRMPLRKVGCNSKSNVKVYRYTEKDIDFFVGVDIDSFDIYPIHIRRLSQYRNSIGLVALKRSGVRNNFTELRRFERVKELAGVVGIEPTSSELEADVLPLNYTPIIDHRTGT